MLNIPYIVKRSVTFIGILICLLTYSVIADETPDTEKDSEVIVNQTEQKTTETVKSAENKDEKEKVVKPDSENTDSTPQPSKEVITGTADIMERDQKVGITILIGVKEQAKTLRFNEQGVEIGFLNADRITLKTNPETGETTEIIAVGNVEIRDQEIFATCDHATMNNLTNIIVLKDNVVVLQNKDRLETKLFTYNRTTGKQTGEGEVKFKVTVTQATPPESSDEVDTNEGTSTDTGVSEEKDTTSDSETKNETESNKEVDPDDQNNPKETVKKDKESVKEKESTPTETEESEEQDPPEETEPTETEESEEQDPPEETEPTETEESGSEETPEEEQ